MPLSNLSPARLLRVLATLVAAAAVGLAPAAQEEDEAPAYTVRVQPAEIRLEVGESVPLSIEVVDAEGAVVDAEVTVFSRNPRAVQVDADHVVTAKQPGHHELAVRAATRPRTRATVAVTVAYPPLAEVRFAEAPDRLYVGTGGEVVAEVVDASGNVREDVAAVLGVEGGDALAVDAFGTVWGRAPGTARLTARVPGHDDLVASVQYTVLANPVRSIHVELSDDHVRTGDVVRVTAMGLAEDGTALPDVPVHLSFEARPDDTLGNGATGQIQQDGRFVAAAPGRYTIVATSGATFARAALRAEPRDVQRRFEVVGRGSVTDTHTSDLWVWEGVDGRDYCVTGTWGANGDAHFWDVTDPSAIERIATVTVDARTVNDVKVSEDGRLCVLSREGASDRKNGIVLVDVTNPREPESLSTFTDELTGGVHNVFIYEDHVYALSNGQRYDIIDVVDPRNPKRVGSFQLDEEGASIHDVWVVDGIAYSSNWRNGVVLVDVGNGIAGGSPENPVEIARYAYPSGWNHAAWPHKNEETGIEYVIAGDEAFPYGLNVTGTPTYARGWLHFIDFTDKENPKEVARYQVPEAGTHNLWVEDDVLYAAFYNGGVRAIDISGELMGDLYEQGREVAWFLPADPEGYVPNAPMVWGPQPHKGTVFFSDWNSGLWAVQLEPSVGE